MVKKAKKRAAKKTVKRKRTKKGSLPQGTYNARILSADLKSHPHMGLVFEVDRGRLKIERPPKTLKAALKVIAALKQEMKQELGNAREDKVQALRAKEIDCLTLRMQQSDHFANRILNIMEEGSKKGNFPIRTN